MNRLIPTLALASTAMLCAPLSAQDHSHDEMMDHSSHTMDPAADKGEHADHLPAEKPTMEEMPSAKPAVMDHGSHGSHAAKELPSGPPPPRAFEGPQHAAELFFDPQEMAAARAYNHSAHGDMTTGTLLVERLEARIADGADGYVWDATGWYGTATDKFVLKSEGEGEFSDNVEDAEIQALWGHAIGPFIDLQVGVRLDVEPETRAHLALGAAGLAPYMIHFDAALFLSDRGDLTGRIEAEHDMRLTQRLILQPRIEAEFAAQDIPERETGAGLTKAAIGARLRYEIEREFAPYVGVEYEAALGETADIARANGNDPDGINFLVGLRFWF